MKIPAVLFLFALSPLALKAQQPQTVTGCVAHVAKVPDKLVLASGDRCLLLAGTYNATQIADHTITATGLVLDPEGMNPLTLKIASVKSVAAACTRTCILDPPGTRGIHGQERPGRPGGTPGLHDPASPQPAPQP